MGKKNSTHYLTAAADLSVRGRGGRLTQGQSQKNPTPMASEVEGDPATDGGGGGVAPRCCRASPGGDRVSSPGVIS